jgi:integrase/recombinase XerC/integrase/recombinase XerD
MAQSLQIIKIQGVPVQSATDATQLAASSDWRQIVATFIANQDVKQSSRRTYARELGLFFMWVFGTGRDFSTMTRTDILAYKDDMLAKGHSNLTVGNYLVTVRKFYEWAEGFKLYPNIAKGVKTPAKKQAFKKQHLTDDKSAELIALQSTKTVIHKDRDGNLEEVASPTAVRDAAIINLLLRCGLRCIEVVRANIEDITFMSGRRVLKVWGKGKDSKDDFVVLTDKAWTPIKAYLDTRKGARMGEPLFVSSSRRNEGGRLTTRSISRLCKDSLRKIGLDGREFSAHSLRHTTAVAILMHGGTITDVQDVLRHASPATSEIYTESVKQDLRLGSPSEARLDVAF